VDYRSELYYHSLKRGSEITRKYKKYGKDFKLEAAKLLTQRGNSYAEAARQQGLEDWTVRGWVKTLSKSDDLPVGSKNSA